MNSIGYKIQHDLTSTLFEPLLATCEAIARLDERVHRSPLLKGWCRRLLVHEACACQLAEGDLVHVTDLVLLDSGAAIQHGSIPLSSAHLVLRSWRHALNVKKPTGLLATSPPAHLPPDEPICAIRLSIPEDELEDAVRQDRLMCWQEVVGTTASQHPLVSAAIAWDAWLELMPERHGAWRAPLIAAIILKARGLTRDFLLPIDLGRRHHPYRRFPHQGATERLQGCLLWMQAAAAEAQRQLTRLSSIEAQLRRIAEGCQKNSRLPALIDLLVEYPVISVPMAARKLSVSKQAVATMLRKIDGIPRQITERRRYIVWGIA